MAPTLPLTILGGSDRKATHLPPSGEDRHPITGCKGVDVRLGGRCLIDVLIDRFADSGYFGPIYIAGPKAVYQACEHSDSVIDTDGGFGRNIQAGIDQTRKLHPETPLAMSTCDILPDPAEIDILMENYRQTAPMDLWFPIVSVPEDPEALGASAWKPKYRVMPDSGGEPVAVLPGHMAIFDPEAIRLRFVYRLLDLAYRTRNRPIGYRRSYMLRRLILGILMQDARLLFRFQLPTLTWEVAHTGMKAARQLRDETISREELEDALRRIFIKRAHQKKYPDRRFSMPILPAVSMARDIDTWEEVAAIGGTATAPT